MNMKSHRLKIEHIAGAKSHFSMGNAILVENNDLKFKEEEPYKKTEKPK